MATPRQPGNSGIKHSPGGRQLTIGEVIALGRYCGPLYDRRGKPTVPLWATLEYIDSLKVCTTCGYLKDDHRVLGDRKTCRHYTRDI
jgi:hypothetical protein